ncbi:MAG: YrzE family protein [Anaerolineales bacterium]
MQTQSPQSTLENKDGTKEPKVSIGRGILAVVVGAIVDIGGSNIVALIYTMILIIPKAIQLTSQGLSQAQIQSQLMPDASTISQSAFIITFGFLLSVLGGYVAGKIAKQNEILFGLATGIAVVVIANACSLALQSPTSFSTLWRTFLTIAGIGAETLGGYLAYLQRASQQHSAV